MPKTVTGGVGSETNVTSFDHLKIDLGKGIVFFAYVGFTEGMDAMAIGLLGQDGFFDQYNVEFRNASGIFTLEEAGDTSDGSPRDNDLHHDGTLRFVGLHSSKRQAMVVLRDPMAAYALGDCLGPLQCSACGPVQTMELRGVGTQIDNSAAFPQARQR
jgi:hypothetical protein